MACLEAGCEAHDDYAAEVRTLGIDLSTAEALTASVELTWEGTGTALTTLGLDDEAVLERMEHADKVGIDAPFGWPDAFRKTIADWSERGTWPAGAGREALRFRCTDVFQRMHGRTPLSVSSDRIAATAMRCADLLARHHERRTDRLDRIAGHAVETYPAGALVAWGIDVRGYKDKAATTRRREIVDELTRRAAVPLEAATLDLCAATDHVLDALVASLVARAQALGLTHTPPAERTAQVAREGWIHVPLADSLERLRRP